VSAGASAAHQHRTYFQLQVVATHTRKLADGLFGSAAGITAAQAGVLAAIASDPGCSQRSIADAMRQRESAITGMVGRLTALGLVERRPHPRDQRFWELWPTPAGAQAIHNLKPALAIVNECIAQAIGDENIEAFNGALKRLSAMTLGPGPTPGTERARSDDG
jgi:MarR family transcriptional regulator, organic hydroperoxide resistance regulator